MSVFEYRRYFWLARCTELAEVMGERDGALLPLVSLERSAVLAIIVSQGHILLGRSEFETAQFALP